MINLPTEQHAENSQVEALKRDLSAFYARRNLLYVKHLAKLDETISIIEADLHRLTQPHRYCGKCGASNTPDGCANEGCVRFNGCGF